MELLDKLQKRIFGPSLAFSFEVFAHLQNVAILDQESITLVDVYLNWLNWFHSLILKESLLIILIDFLSPFLDVTRMSMSKFSFLAQLESAILFL